MAKLEGDGSMAANNDGFSPRLSSTISTARSRTAGENLVDLLMTQSSQSVEPPQKLRRFTIVSMKPPAEFDRMTAATNFFPVSHPDRRIH